MHEMENYCNQTWEIKLDIKCEVIKFEINLNLFNHAFSMHNQKVKAKAQISWEQKEHISSFLKGFQLPKIVLDLRVCL